VVHGQEVVADLVSVDESPLRWVQVGRQPDLLAAEREQASHPAQSPLPPEAFARLLLPSSDVERRFAAAKESAGKVTNAMLLAEADYWQVSLQAMVLRLEDLRLVRSDTGRV
jgi:hypothetical protein